MLKHDSNFSVPPATMANSLSNLVPSFPKVRGKTYIRVEMFQYTIRTTVTVTIVMVQCMQTCHSVYMHMRGDPIMP